jgi:hypothetical protein
MRIASLTLLALATVPLAAPLRAQQPPAAPTGQAMEPPSIIATGSGEARVTPDRAVVMIGVQSRGASAAAASASNATRQRAIIDTIVALGIPRERIATMQYNVYPEMRHDPAANRERVTGYVVSNTIRVELHRIDQVSVVIDASLAKGANQINSLNFYAQNTDEPRRQALAQAVARARADAEAMARAAGGSLGDLMELSTGQLSVPIPVRRELMAARGVAGDAATPIEPGEEVVRAQVTARWRFVTGG